MKEFLYPADALLMAPLSGYTDLPYRRTMRRCSCCYAFTEMIDAAALAYARKRTENMLARGEEEAFLGVQLVGSNLEHLKIAIDVLNEYSFDVLDFNLGCPVPKITRKNAGAELGRHCEEALRCFALFPERSRFPVTAKIRIVDENDPAPTLELCRGLAQLGARAITIHGRIREAFYSGPVHYEIIRAVKDALPEIQIIGNGGVCNAATYAEMREKSTCYAVMLARGAMGNPWLFRTLRDPQQQPDFEEYAAMIRRHTQEMCAYYGEETAMKLARKILHDYLKGRGFHSDCKAYASTVKTLSDAEALLRKLEENKSLYHALV